jgi:hypothetical protein
MKRNAKLTVFLIVAALSIFMAAASASAGPTSIKGHYALSGFTSCSFVGPQGELSPANPGILEADYTFNLDGTGSATGWVRQTRLSEITHYVRYNYLFSL